MSTKDTRTSLEYELDTILSIHPSAKGETDEEEKEAGKKLKEVASKRREKAIKKALGL